MKVKRQRQVSEASKKTYDCVSRRAMRPEGTGVVGGSALNTLLVMRVMSECESEERAKHEAKSRSTYSVRAASHSPLPRLRIINQKITRIADAGYVLWLLTIKTV